MLLLIGFCQGYFCETRQVRDNSITEHSVLVQTTVTNKFGLQEEKFIQVRLSKKHMESGINNVWNQLKDKQVAVPVFVQPWASKAGNAGFDYWLSGDGKPVTNLQLSKSPAPVAAVS